ARDGHAGIGERRDHSVLTVDGVGRRQELAGRLATDHVLTAGAAHVVGGIRLASLELADGQRSAEPGDPLDDVALERADVEAMARQDVDRGGRRHGAHCKLVAGKLIVAVKGDKQSIRERVWALLERRRAGRFPFPLAGRIPNFRGAEAAAARVATLPEWKAAKRLKCNPDAPQRALRLRALREGKIVFMAVPRLRRVKCFLRLDPARLGTRLAEAATIAGASKLGEPVTPPAQAGGDRVAGAVGRAAPRDPCAPRAQVWVTSSQTRLMSGGRHAMTASRSAPGASAKISRPAYSLRTKPSPTACAMNRRRPS